MSVAVEGSSRRHSLNVGCLGDKYINRRRGVKDEATEDVVPYAKQVEL